MLRSTFIVLGFILNVSPLAIIWLLTSNVLFMSCLFIWFWAGHEKESSEIGPCERICSGGWISEPTNILNFTKCCLQVNLADELWFCCESLLNFIFSRTLYIFLLYDYWLSCCLIGHRTQNCINITYCLCCDHWKVEYSLASNFRKECIQWKELIR